MKQEIINRIEKLGANISNIKGKSLQKDLESINFNTVLYPNPKDTPLAKSEEQEVIYGINHEVFFDEITKRRNFRRVFDSFMTKEELIEIVKAKLEK